MRDVVFDHVTYIPAGDKDAETWIYDIKPVAGVGIDKGCENG